MQQRIDKLNDMDIKHLKHDKAWLQAKARLREYLGANPSSTQIDELLKTIADEGNKNVPLKLDENWELMRLSSGHLAYHHYSRLTSSTHDFIPDTNKQNVEQRKREFVKDNEICSIFDAFFEYGVSINYHYYNANGGYIQSLTISADDCS